MSTQRPPALATLDRKTLLAILVGFMGYTICEAEETDNALRAWVRRDVRDGLLDAADLRRIAGASFVPGDNSPQLRRFK